ncbi:MAG: aminoglycoside phosphotransferase family protein [Candidatus Doudnabacteria bacterium]|nr:aminoglycoside phosphotransferase family protein [Candidatus Doudnabacteria bacterium]
MPISPETINKVETLLGNKISIIGIPESGLDHEVFIFTTPAGKKCIAKANHNAVVDALVLRKLEESGISIPTPKVLAYSEEYKLSVIEFIEGKMLDAFETPTIVPYLLPLLTIARRIHQVTGNQAGAFLKVSRGAGSDWKSSFGAKYGDNHPYYKWDNLIQNPGLDKEVIITALGRIKAGIESLPEPQTYSLLHSDLHGGNVIVAKNEIKGIIDWSDANYGDPLYEFSRIRLFVVQENKKMLEIYYNLLDMSAEEKQREELYFLAHALRIVFFANEEKVPSLLKPNYERLERLVRG